MSGPFCIIVRHMGHTPFGPGLYRVSALYQSRDGRRIGRSTCYDRHRVDAVRSVRTLAGVRGG